MITQKLNFIDFMVHQTGVKEKEKLLLMAQNSNMVKFSEIDDNDYPTSTDSVQYDIDAKTYLIVITDCYGETDEVYSAKAINDIDELPEEF